MTTPPQQPPTFLDRRNEDVVLRNNYRGRIACRTLTIPQGMSVFGEVVADKTLVAGRMEGTVTGTKGVQSLIHVEDGGEFVGEAHATNVVVAGSADAILHGVRVTTKATAVVNGYILSATLVHDPKSRMDAGLFVGPDRHKSNEHLAIVRRLRGMNPALREVGLGIGDVSVVSATNDVDREIEASLAEALEDFAAVGEIRSQPTADVGPEVAGPEAVPAAPQVVVETPAVAEAPAPAAPIAQAPPAVEVAADPADTTRPDPAPPVTPPRRDDRIPTDRVVPSLIRRRPALGQD